MTQPALIPDTDPQLAPLFAIVEKLAALLSERQPQVMPAPQAIWIPLQQASEISGLSEGLLHRLIQAERLFGVRDVTVKVRRADIEALDPKELLDLPPARKRTRGARKK